MHVKEKLQSLSIDRSAYAKPQGRAKIWLLAGFVALAAISFAVLLGSQPSGQAVAAAPLIAPASVVRSPPASGTVASGYVIARRAATVSADITGRLVKVHFEEGALVKQGQVLAELDDGLARYDLELAQARLQSARATVEAVKADLSEGEAQLRRAEQLSRTSTISPVALDNARTRIQSLAARHDAAIADARVAQVAVDRQTDFVERHKIRAPFSGVIIAKNAQSGEILSSSAGGGEFTRSGIATLVDMASLEVEVDVNEGRIAGITEAQTASVVLDAYPDMSIPGEVIAVIPTADRDRATIQVRVAFKKLDPRILPQMAAKVTFDRTED
jgi:HlyD family secretion protein